MKLPEDLLLAKENVLYFLTGMNLYNKFYSGKIKLFIHWKSDGGKKRRVYKKNKHFPMLIIIFFRVESN